MTEKFSYYDLLAYLVPGTLVMWAVIQFAEAIDILQFASTESTLLDASAFVVVAFLAGHLVQAESQRRLDESHWYSVFPTGFPSRSFLVYGQKDENGKPWCTDTRRNEYILAAHRGDLLSKEQVLLLKSSSADEDKLEQARRASQEAYQAAYGFLTDEGRAQKAIVANQTYGLFRDLAMTCAVVTALFFLILVVGLVRLFGELGSLLETWPGFAELILYPVVVIILFAYASWSFRLRARHRGKHHVREVFDTLLGASIAAGKPAEGEPEEVHSCPYTDKDP
jgi:hypothetical protein